MTNAAEQLRDLAEEFNDLREEAAFLRKRLDRIGPKITQMRPRIAEAIRAASVAGKSDQELADLTGYTAERVRQIVRGGSVADEKEAPPAPRKSARSRGAKKP